MPFVLENNQVVFAEPEDLIRRDQRLFDSNEGITNDVVYDSLIRSTERILTKLRSSPWWRGYYVNRGSTEGFRTTADIPPLDPTKIIARQNDFTDLCVFFAFSEFILPMIADFGDEDSSERQKMSYYKVRADEMYGELITAGDWYDFDGDGTITADEKQPGAFNLKRVR